MSDSVHSADAGDDARSPRIVARAAIPTLIAVAAVALVLVAIRSHAVEVVEMTTGPAEPTPYSAMEGRIPPAQQPEETPPATF